MTDTANFRNPHYHRPTDTPETFDDERVAAIVRATVLLLARAAGLVGGGQGRYYVLPGRAMEGWRGRWARNAR
ncbi:MAG: hypothetical protein ACRDJE_23455 [Dehalococcoidia bacterium]